MSILCKILQFYSFCSAYKRKIKYIVISHKIDII